jgi:hypothetical protein
MADRRTTLDKALDRTRRELSQRIMKARREGRLYEELKAIEREGESAWREIQKGERNGKSNGRKRKPK